MKYNGKHRNQILGPFLAHKRALMPPRRPPCKAVNAKPLSFRRPVMMVTIFFEAVHQKLISGQKTVRRAPKRPRLLWAKNGPKIWFFYATPIKSLFFGLRRTWLNEIITSTYPEVTLDTFSFPEGGRLAARQAVVWPQLPKMALFGTKNAYYSIVSHGIVWYCMVLLCILWYCIVLHVIALYRMVLHGIVLLALARGLYLARHLPTLLYCYCIVLIYKK